MPKAFSDEFRADVIAAARNRSGSIAEVAAGFGVSASCVQRWLAADDQQQATAAGDGQDVADVRAMRRKIAQLEQENHVLRQAAGYLSRGLLPK